MESNAILNVVKEGLVIDLSRHAIKLHQKYGECFKDPEPGVYILNKNYPVIYPGSNYYSRSSFKSKTPLQDLNGVKEDILNEYGKVIIPRWVMENPKRYIRNKPNLPVREIDVLELLIRDYVDSLLAFNEPEDRSEKYDRLIKPEFRYMQTEGYLEAAAREIIDMVSVFVGADVWNMYDYKRQQSDLTVLKGEDWRIYDWTLQKEKETEEKNNSEQGE